MQLGMVGLGWMGANMTRRLIKAGHEIVTYDRNAEAVQALAGEGAVAAGSRLGVFVRTRCNVGAIDSSRLL